MKLTRPLLLLFFAIISQSLLLAQVSISEEFRLGDTTQTHQVITMRGDIFNGRVIEMNQSKIKFLFKGNTLTLNLDEIKNISVFNENEPIQVTELDPSTRSKDGSHHIWRFDYEVLTDDGNRQFGTFTKFTKYGLYFNSGSKDAFIISLGKLDSLNHVGHPLQPNPYYFPEYQLLTTSDNSTFIGAIVSIADQKLTFMLRNGSFLNFDLNDIILITVEYDLENQGFRSKRFRDFSDNQQRVFFTPSAFLLKKGVKEYRTMVLLNNIDFGISDNFNAGTGLFSVIVATAVTGKVKLGASLTEQLHVAVGAQGLLAIPTFDTGEFSMGLFYGALSIGNPRNYISVSVGRGKSSEDYNGSSGLGIGSSLTVGQNWRLNLEYFNLNQNDNFFGNNDNDNYILGNMGLSWYRSNHQIDFGIAVSTIFDGDTVGFPVFGYSNKF